jgi:hypothetical protein
MKKKKFLFVAILAIFALSLVLSAPNSTKASAAAIDPEQASAATDTEYCIGFSGADLDAGDWWQIQFDASFDLSNLTISDTAGDSEVELYIGEIDCTEGTKRITEDTPTGANNRDSAVITDETVELTLEDAISGDWSIKFVDKAADGSVMTPAAGNYKVVYRWGTGATTDGNDADLLYVGDANVVVISGTVDPTLSLTLSDNTCELGTLSSANIQTCNYSAAIATNASGGYTAYIKDDGNLRDGSNDVNDTSGGNIGEGTEEYGVSTTQNGRTITRINDADTDPADLYNQDDCIIMDGGTIDANASALTASDQSFAAATAPASETTYLCHAASITSTTPAGTYASLVTITVVGSF